MSAGRWRTCCASRRIAWSAPTIASPGSAAASRFRRNVIATTMSAPPCACTNTRTDGSPSSMARVVWPASIQKDAPMTSSVTPLNSARRPRSLWICGQRKRVAHKPHRPNNKRSGHLMCYKTRTSSRATDTEPPAGWKAMAVNNLRLIAVRRCRTRRVNAPNQSEHPRDDALGAGGIGGVGITERLQHHLLFAAHPKGEQRAEADETGRARNPIRQQQRLRQRPQKVSRIHGVADEAVDAVSHEPMILTYFEGHRPVPAEAAMGVEEEQERTHEDG